MKTLEQMILFEQRFWLPILRDHCQFILDSLSPTEKNEVKSAKALLHVFDDLVKTFSHPSPALDLNYSYRAAKKLRKFKLHLLRRLLTDEFAFHLSPTFINHMLNEIDEYLRILSYFLKGEEPPLLHPVHHHLLWLPDAAGHAVGIETKLDGVEKNLRERSRYFIRQFEAFYIKAVELAGYLRTNLKQFPALSKFNKDVELEIILFQKFLQELEEMSLSKEVLSTLLPLLPDHMFREECYYLYKLSQVSEVKKPDCSPHP